MVIHRLRTGENIVLQRSHCPHCHGAIAWRDNIPVVGYLFLRGKCRNCRKKISLQYPLVELITGGVFASVGYFYVAGFIEILLVGVLYALAFAGLIVICVYDFLYMEIPMSVLWSAVGFLALAIVCIDVYAGFPEGVWRSTIGIHSMSAGVVFCFFFGLSYFSDETWMGYGDAFIAIAIGLLLGPIGSFLALLLAFCAGAIGGIFLLFAKGRTMKTAVPFGPFLIFGLYVVFVLQTVFPNFAAYFI